MTLADGKDQSLRSNFCLAENKTSRVKTVLSHSNILGLEFNVRTNLSFHSPHWLTTPGEAGPGTQPELHRAGGRGRQGRLRGRLAEAVGGQVLQAGDQGSVMAGRHLISPAWVLLDQTECLITRQDEFYTTSGVRGGLSATIWSQFSQHWYWGGSWEIVWDCLWQVLCIVLLLL